MMSVCDKKKFGRSTAYSCGTNVFLLSTISSFYEKRKGIVKTKQPKQNIFKSMKIYGFL